LINALVVLAAAASTQPAKPWWAGLFDSMLFPMALILGVFYFIMIKSKRGQEKQLKNMLSNLKKGDRVQTIGGILGTVVEAREDEVLVKVDESANTKIRFTRKAIHKVVETDRTLGGKSAS
jgi:preprotein translocase subunit YajC